MSDGREWWVIPDTNFLLIPGQFGVDVFSELERILDVRFRVLVPTAVIKELSVIERKSRGRDLLAVRMAKEIVKRFDTVDIGEFGRAPTDELIYAYAASRPNVIVCTNDKELKKRLRQAGVPVVYLRSRKILKLEGTLFRPLRANSRGA
ncbi:MAG: nucleotide-binding protein [Thermococci archaeon]|nr:nucleotide-binding protein [Thermococci archaeon]